MSRRARMPRGARIVMAILAGLLCALVDGQSEAIAELDVATVCDEFGEQLRTWSCEVLRAGGDPRCTKPGLSDVFDTLMTEKNGFQDMKLELLEDIVEKDLAEQVSGAFESMLEALREMQQGMTTFVLERLRVDSLTAVNHTEIPSYDTSNPRFKNLTETSLENTDYGIPVARESVLQYPTSVDRNDRQVRIVANASVGLDENFLAILHDNSDAVMSSVRWQRFTSDTGVTRQFPASFDDSGRDQRLETWYCQATQVAKRVLLILDMSDSMLGGGRVETGKEAVFTILRTLTQQDSVNVLLIAGSSPGLPFFAPKGLVPATAYNIAALTEWVNNANVMGQQEVTQVLADALGHINVVKTSQEQSEEAVPPGIKHYLFVVSDGEFLASDLGYSQGRLDSVYLSIKESLLRDTHVMTVAVGQGAKERDLRAISCRFNGFFFMVPAARGHSAMRTSLEKWYQLLAAPLAKLQGSGAQAPSWTVPYLSSSGKEIIITVALPCFVDIDLDRPQLIGAVALDLTVSAKGDSVWSSILPLLRGFRPRTPAGVAAVSQGLEVALVLRQANEGVALSNPILLAQYSNNVADSEQPLQVLQHRLQSVYENDSFRRERVLDKVLASVSGSHTTRAPSVHRGAMLCEAWDLASDQRVDKPSEMQATSYAWKRLQGTDMTILVSLPRSPGAKDGFVKGWTSAAFSERPAARCESFSAFPQLQEALRRGSDRPCAAHEACPACGLDPPVAEGSEMMGTVQFQNVSLDARGAGGQEGQTGRGRDVLILPLAATASDVFLASSPVLAWQRAACRQASRAKAQARVGARAEGVTAGGGADVCEGLTRRELMHELDMTAAATLLWTQAENVTSNASSAGLARTGWRGTRFVTALGGVTRMRLADPLLIATNANAQSESALPSTSSTATGPGEKAPEGAVFRELLNVSALSFSDTNRAVVNAYKARGLLAITPAAAPQYYRSFAGTSSLSTPVLESFLTLTRTLTSAGNAVIGGEVSRGTLWQALYKDANKGLCSRQESSAAVRCYLLNQGGAVLLSPQDTSPTCPAGMRTARDGCWPVASWPQSLTFLADFEPAGAEFLVWHGLLRKYEVSHPALRATITGYEIVTDKLSELPLTMRGAVTAEMHLRQVSGTDAYLLVMAKYRVIEQIPLPRSTCGVLSRYCSNLVFPAIIPHTLETSHGQDTWSSSAAPRRTVLAMSPVVDMRLMVQMRLDDYCSVPTPSWVMLIGWCTAGLVFMGLGVAASYKRRMRQLAKSKFSMEDEQDVEHELQMKLIEEEERADSLLQDFLARLGLGPDLESVQFIKEYVHRRQQRLSELTLYARDAQDMTSIVYEQSALLDTVADAKEGLVRAIQGELENVAARVIGQALLAKNLQQRTEMQEGSRPSAAAVREVLAKLGSTLKSIEERVDWLKMPPVKVVEAAGDSERMKNFEVERDFYSKHYPHVVQYSTYDGTATSRRSARISTSNQSRFSAPAAARDEAL